MSDDNGKFYELMEAIQTYLTAQLPPPILQRIEIYEGVYDADGVMRLVTSEGVAHLAFLGVNNIDELAGGPANLHASFAVYIASSGVARVRKALNRLEAIAIKMIGVGHNGLDLGVTYVGQPVIGSIENLYSKPAGQNGVVIYGLSFAIPILLGDMIFKDEESPLDPTKWFVTDEADGVDLFSFQEAEPQPPEEG